MSERGAGDAANGTRERRGLKTPRKGRKIGARERSRRRGRREDLRRRSPRPRRGARGTARRRRRGRRHPIPRPRPGGGGEGCAPDVEPWSQLPICLPFRGGGGPGASSGIPLGFERDFLALNWSRSGVPSWAPAQKLRQPSSPCGVGVAWEPNYRPGFCLRLGAPPRDAWRPSGESQEHCSATHLIFTAEGGVAVGTLEERKKASDERVKTCSQEKPPTPPTVAPRV